ncbi:MAG: glycosyltransferase, partial [Terriglobia bacterium]
GKPVIGAEAGGIPYVISDGRDGLLVQFGDIAGLASRIADLLSDPSRRHSLGEAGRQKVLAYYTWDKVCDRMSEVTNSFLHR